MGQTIDRVALLVGVFGGAFALASVVGPAFLDAKRRAKALLKGARKRVVAIVHPVHTVPPPPASPLPVGSKWDGDLGNASHCATCGCDLQLEPDPPKSSLYPWRLGPRAAGPNIEKEWVHVAIRCAFCLKVYCPKCSRLHFSPTHVASPGAEIVVEKREAFVVAAEGVALRIVLDEEEAKESARGIALSAGHPWKPPEPDGRKEIR